jgi:peptidoglycan hydrolase-like protein with peptidoglycan-binding domain
VWQFATGSDWGGVGDPLDPLVVSPAIAWPTLHAGSGGKVGSRGDLVVRAQELLVGAGAAITPDGAYGSGTAAAVSDFQLARGLPQTGVLDAATWPVLLKETPVMVDWVARAKAKAGATAASSGARAASVSAAGSLPAGPNGPSSAGLPARRNEIPPGPR